MPTASDASRAGRWRVGWIYLVFTSAYARSADELADEAHPAGAAGSAYARFDEARGAARTDDAPPRASGARTADGEVVTLGSDRSRWDHEAVAEALALTQLPSTPRGSYRVQADLAAVHATTEDAAGTDWAAMVSLYDELLQARPLPGRGTEPGDRCRYERRAAGRAGGAR